jgi:hypothetical protein
MCWFFTSFYFELYIWPDVISQWCLNICKELHQTASDDATFLSRVITANESWIYGYASETKQQSSQWKSANSPRPKSRDRWQRHCSQRICPGRLNSQFYMLLWHFVMTVWKYAETSPRTLATKELAVVLWQCTVSHFLFRQGFFLPEITWLSSPVHSTHVTGPPATFRFYPVWRWNLNATSLTWVRWSTAVSKPV